MEKKKSQFKQFFTSFFSFYRCADLDMTSVAVAYYLIISIFPILMTLANLLPYLQLDIGQILFLIREIFPEKLYPMVEEMISTILTRPSNSWLWISILTTLWTISKSMTALQKAVNQAYGVTEHRGFILSHLLGIFLGIGLQVIILMSVLALTFGQAAIQAMKGWFKLEQMPIWQFLSQTQPLVYLVLFLSLIMLYYFLPNVRIERFRFVLPGTIFVMLVMGTVGHLFRVYVDAYANRLLDFRFVTSVILLVLMLWFVFFANILIIGSVLNATVQSLFVDEFYTRNGNVVSILNGLKRRIKGTETQETKELVPLREKEK